MSTELPEVTSLLPGLYKTFHREYSLGSHVLPPALVGPWVLPLTGSLEQYTLSFLSALYTALSVSMWQSSCPLCTGELTIQLQMFY